MNIQNIEGFASIKMTLFLSSLEILLMNMETLQKRVFVLNRNNIIV